MGPLIILVVTFALMWVLFIVPQQRRVRSHQALVGRVAVGQEVMTSAGLFGTVVGVDDEEVRLEIAPGTVVRFARGAVARILDEERALETTGTDAADTDIESTDTNSRAVARPAGTAADRALDRPPSRPEPEPEPVTDDESDGGR